MLAYAPEYMLKCSIQAGGLKSPPLSAPSAYRSHVHRHHPCRCTRNIPRIPTHPEGVAGWRGRHLHTPRPPSPLSFGLVPSFVSIYTSYSSSCTVRGGGRVGVTYTGVVHSVILYFEVKPSARISMFLPQYLYYFYRNTPPPSPLLCGSCRLCTY